ncbi:hypothetical protein HZV92_001816 [Salmonella enterica]|nr:hypothetical protein [Salmonella enterica]EFQ6618155.1 hypothetical protein [Salmonella enterica]
MLNTVGSFRSGAVALLAGKFSTPPALTVKNAAVNIKSLVIAPDLKMKLEAACEAMKGNRNDVAGRHRENMKIKAEAARMKAGEVNEIMKGIEAMASTLQRTGQYGAPPPPPPIPTDAQLTACRISSDWNLASQNDQPETMEKSRTREEIKESLKLNAANDKNKAPTSHQISQELLLQKLRQMGLTRSES